MAAGRSFDLADILSLVTGITVGKRGVVGMKEVVTHMTQGLGLPWGEVDEYNLAREGVLAQHPKLRAVEVPVFRDGDQPSIDAWVAEQKKKLRKNRLVLKRLPKRP